MNDAPHHSTKPPPDSCNPTGDRDNICIATWNVNSVKARLPALTSYLESKHPDILMLQEIKTEDFPALELSGLGYCVLAKGQKSYNGVALVSKEPAELIADTLPNAPDNGEQARFIEAYLPSLNMRALCVYVPNGEPPATDTESTERLEYKLAWMRALADYAEKLTQQETPYVIGGDFNVIEFDTDVYNAAAFAGSAFTNADVRNLFRTFYYNNLTNALRRYTDARAYSFWDYRAGAWEKDNGILLDHLFLSPVLADRLTFSGVDRDVRGEPKASDHAPVRCLLSLQ